MPRVKISDLLAILKGMQSITNALIKHQENTIRYRIVHSSLRKLPEKCLQAVGEKLNNTEPSKIPVSFQLISMNDKHEYYFQLINMNIILYKLPSIRIVFL